MPKSDQKNNDDNYPSGKLNNRGKLERDHRKVWGMTPNQEGSESSASSSSLEKVFSGRVVFADDLVHQIFLFLDQAEIFSSKVPTVTSLKPEPPASARSGGLGRSPGPPCRRSTTVING